MAPETSSLHVLVVDDDSLLRWSVVETLAHAGCAVEGAPDGASALRAIADAAAPFDVVLLDYRLPDSKDLSLLARVHHRSPSSALVFMTAFGTPDLVRAAEEFGACRVLPKPFEMADIEHVVLAAARQRFSA